ncbi:MAG: hypothetical protein MJ147_06350 [Clostridia bacterium]|nr:hypothetical protein [Clostridia bacterium]
MKKIISLLLCVLMMFSVLPLSAFAADETYDAKLMPIIFKQPKDVKISTDYSGAKSTKIKAAIPSGDAVEYSLFYIDPETGAETDVSKKISGIAISGSCAEGEYYLVAFNSNHPEYKVKSENFTLKKHKATIFDKAEEAISGSLFLSAFTPIGLITVTPTVLIELLIDKIENMIIERKLATIK